MDSLNLFFSSGGEMAQIFILSVAAGTAQAVSPDRWMPLSIHSWQRGWKSERALRVGALLASIHVALGVLLFFLILPLLRQLNPNSVSVLAAAVILGGSFARLFRFRRMREVLGSGIQGRWGVPAVLSLMGPCELALPLLLKAGMSGHGYFVATLGLLSGTLLGVLSLASLFRRSWNVPTRLAALVEWTQGPGVAVPTAALSMGVILALRGLI